MVRRALFKLISETVININSIPINTTVFAKKAYSSPAPRTRSCMRVFGNQRTGTRNIKLVAYLRQHLIFSNYPASAFAPAL